MRTILFILGMLSCVALQAQQHDKLSVWTSGDTAIVTDLAEQENCAARFAFDVTANGNAFRITQRDTVKEKARCICRFELVTTLVGYAPGTYTADVYREYLAKFGYGSDTTVFIGSLTFDLATHTRPATSIENRQGECDHYVSVPELNPNSITLYPVPVRNTAFMSFDERWVGHVTVSIYDECGQKVLIAFDGRYDGGLKWLELAQTAFPSSGMYHVVIESPTGIVSRMVPVVK